MSTDPATAFIARWSTASPSERANSQLFLSELCDLLDVSHPSPARDQGYAFEFEVTQHHPDGTATRGRIDLYKRGCFVLESKQFQAAKCVGSPARSKAPSKRNMCTWKVAAPPGGDLWALNADCG